MVAGDVREWWVRHLGARPDPAGSWVLRDHPGHSIETPGRFRQLDLHTYGAVLEAVLFEPDERVGTVVVPFYDTASVFGEHSPRTRLTGRLPQAPLGPALARAGLSVLAVPWWFEQEALAAPTRGSEDLAGRYGPAATKHAVSLPMTALGRSVGDLMLAVRALLDAGLAERGSIATFGHSLGGKLALHLGALDEHVDVVACHEAGIGFRHSNWDAPWYLGNDIPAGRDQDELVGLVAPRPLLVAGGGDADGEHNRHLLDEVSDCWPEDEGPQVLFHDHGHQPPQHVVDACASWLRDQLSARVQNP